MTTKKPTLIFDGDCGFCTSTANYILKYSKTPVEIQPWQWAELSEYGLLASEAADRVYLVDGGQTYGGHEAFAQLLRLQKNPLLSAFAFLMLVPPFCWLAKAAYALVARYRHKLPGGTPACKMPRN